MDEADRCDRVALIQRGRLLAVDTPDAIARVVRSSAARASAPAKRYRGAARAARIRSTRTRSIRSATSLHYTDDARTTSGRSRSPRELRAFLASRGFADAAVEPIAPTVEDTLHGAHGRARRQRADGMTPTLAIEAHDLTRRFGAFTAVDRITFDVRAGEVFGFLGANGAGKTTAIRMLTGLLAPTSRHARPSPATTSTRESEAIKRDIGYMSQRFSLYEDLTVAREHPSLRRHLRSDATARSASARTGCSTRLGLEHAAERVRPRDSARLAAEARVLRRAAARAADRVSRRADERRRSDHAPPVLGADLRGGGRRHDGARHDALHGRSGVLRSHLDHGRRDASARWARRRS